MHYQAQYILNLLLGFQIFMLGLKIFGAPILWPVVLFPVWVAITVVLSFGITQLINFIYIKIKDTNNDS